MANEFIIRKGYKSLAASEVTGSLKITGDTTIGGRILSSYTGTSAHTLQNSTSNGTILTLTSTGDSRTLTLQSDHIFSNGSFYLGNNSYSTNFRGSSYDFANGNATFAGDVTLGSYTGSNTGGGGQTTFGALSIFENSGTAALFLGVKNASYANRGWSFNTTEVGVNSKLELIEHGLSGTRLTIASGGNATFAGTITSPKITVAQGTTYANGYRVTRTGHDTYRIGLGNSEGLRIINESDGAREELAFDGAGNAAFSGTTTSTKVNINQAADEQGLEIKGYDDHSSSDIKLQINSSGHARLSQTTDGSSGYLFLQAENYLQLIAGSFVYTTSTFRVYDNTQLQFGNSGDYKIYHSTSADTLYIHTDDNKGITIDNAGNTTFTEDVVVQGTLTAQEFKTELVSASIVFESGSTIFGNSNDDTHDFTGTLNVTSSAANTVLTIGNSGTGGVNWGIYSANSSSPQAASSGDLLFRNASSNVFILQNNLQANFYGNVNLLDNKMLMWGGNSILKHTGTATEIGDNSSSSTISISDGATTFAGDVTLNTGTAKKLSILASTHDTNTAQTATLELGYTHSGGAAVGNIVLTETANNAFDADMTFGLPYNNGSGGSSTRTVLTLDGSDQSATFAGNISVTGTSFLDGLVTIDHNLNIQNNGVLKMAGTEVISATRGISATTGTFTGDVSIAEKLIHSGDTNTYIQFPGTNDKIVFTTNGVDRLTLDAANVATFAGDLTVSGGDITLGGTGRIQGIDTVSASTDAANKAYVDANAGGISNVVEDTTPQLGGNLDMNGKMLFETDQRNSIDLVDHSSYTWLRNEQGGWVFQQGTAGDNWTLSYNIFLPAGNTAGNNDQFMQLGQRVSNSTNGSYKGTRIVQYKGGVVDGQLKASLGYFSGDTIEGVTDTANAGIFLSTANRGVSGLFASSYARNLIRSDGSATIEIGDNTSLLSLIKLNAGSSSVNGVVSFMTKGSERMRVHHDGNVGIGTTSPSNGKLQIDSSSNQISIETGTSGDGRLHIGHFANGTFIGTYGDDGGAADLIRFGTHSGDERMRITSAGNVGIGTTSPSTKFHVVGAATDNQSLGLFTNNYSSGGVFYPALKAVNTYSNHSYGTVAEFRSEASGGTDRPSILFSNAHADHYWTVGQGGYSANDNFAITYRSFHPNSGNGWGTSRLMINTSGNVGIGTNSPSAKLHLAVSSANDDTFHIFNGSVRTHLLGSESTNGVIYLRNSSNSNTVRINTSGNSYFNGGNFGIGTTSPSATLHIVDAANSGVTSLSANGRIKLSGDGVITWGASANYGILTWDTSKAIIASQGSNRLHLATSGNSDQVVLSGDHVGVGLSNPAHLLHVQGDDTDGVLVISRTSNTDQKLFLRSGAGSGEARVASQYHLELKSGLGGSNAYDLSLSTSAGVALKIDGTNQYVGIGTTGPGAKLEVGGANAAIWINPADGAHAGLHFRQADTFKGFVGYNDSANVVNLSMDGSIVNGINVNSSHNVGIGTTTPAEKLEVNGSIKLGSMKLQNVSAGGRIGFNRNTANGAIYDSSYEAFQVQSNGSGYLETQAYNSSGAYQGSLYFTTAGNLGIGNSSTAAKLDVEAGALGSTSGNSTTAAIFRAGRQNLIFRDTRTANDSDWRNATFKIIAQIDSTNHQSIDFVNDNNYYEHIDIRTGNQVFHSRFTFDGKLGIGTTNPLYTLQVAGSTYVNGGTLFIDSGNRLAWGNSNQFIEGTNDTSLEFGTGGSTRMYLNNSGNLGIGTTNPTYTLQVQGTGYFNSTLYVNGTTTINDDLIIDHNIIGNSKNFATANAWASGSGTQTGYYGGNFGGDSQGIVKYDVGPFGSRELIQETVPDTASDYDGGWNKTITELDINKVHMSVVYVRRITSQANGSFYHGTGTSTGQIQNLNGTNNTNPYFQSTGVSTLPQNVWCVSIGFIQANNDTNTDTGTQYNSRSGIYRLDTGQKINNGSVYKFGPNGSTLSSGHRTFMYYSSDNATKLQFARPGFYEMNGDAPTFESLVGKPVAISINQSGNPTLAANVTAAEIRSLIGAGTGNGTLTSESDTLATVTGRGASTSTASTFSGGLTANTLRLTATSDASVSSTGHAFQAGATNSTNIIIDNNEIMARNNGAVSALNLNPDGGNITIHNNTSAGTFTIGSYTVWHAGNDGPGSGLNADLLDGIGGDGYLRSNAADTSTAEILFDAGFKSDSILLTGAQNFDNISRSGFYNLYNTQTSSTNSPPLTYGTMIVVGGNKQNNSFGLQIAHERTGTGLYVRGMNDSSSTWYDWDEIWTSGTDGAGSGLDADTVDGIQGANLLRSDTSDTMNGTLTVTGNVSHAGLTMTSGTDVDQLTTVNMTYTLAANTWTDTGINSSELSTGTYAIQLFVDDHSAGGGHYDVVYSGMMSWYGSNTNSANVDEIVLHRAGHATNNSIIQLRTQMHSGGSPNLMLQVKQNFAHTAAMSGTTDGRRHNFKFRRLI